MGQRVMNGILLQASSSIFLIFLSNEYLLARSSFTPKPGALPCQFHQIDLKITVTPAPQTIYWIF